MIGKPLIDNNVISRGVDHDDDVGWAFPEITVRSNQLDLLSRLDRCRLPASAFWLLAWLLIAEPVEPPAQSASD
jgi:hypothetical protein